MSRIRFPRCIAVSSTLAAGWLSVALPASVEAQEDASIFFDNYVKPHLTAYGSCAKQHIAQIAQKEPASSFDRIEISLRPACGIHIDRARAALAQAGLDKNQINGIIRAAYNGIQPELRSLYDQTASYERQRRQAEREEAARAQRAQEAELARQQQAKEADQERDKLLKEAANEHNACLLNQMKEIVPFSNESAETLAQVIITKCAESEKKYVSLGVAFYGGSKSEMQKIVKDAVDERKKHIVADIVTFRASVTKELMTQPKSNSDVSQTKPANGI